MMKILEGLNKEQIDAIGATSGPVLVVAGAGTGKTEVITKKIANLVESGLAKPEEILALTFTDKAASEMLERVDLLSSQIYPDFTITTFHGLGDQILRRHALDLGLTTEFRVLSQAEQLLFLRDNIFKFDLDYYRPKSDPVKFLSELSKNFSRAKDELVTFEEYLRVAVAKTKKAKTPEEKEEAVKISEVARAFKRYNELLLEAGYVDYGDLIYLPWQLFTSHPSVIKKWRDRYKYFLIDEFQDTNYGQYELLKVLSKGAKNLTVVADDDQAIYRFRGAAVYNVITFLKDFPGAMKITLTKNYRSTQKILDFSHEFIKKNDPDRLEVVAKIDKKLSAANPDRVKQSIIEPELMLFESESSEADMVADRIARLNEDGVDWSEIAVLVRANKHADSILRSLASKKIPFIFSGAAGLYSREEIKIALAFFQTMADPNENLALYHLATSEAYELPVKQMAELLNGSRYANKPLLKLLEDPSEFLAARSQKFIEQAAALVTDIEKYRELSKKQSAGQLLNTFLQQSGYLKRLVEEQDKGDIESANKIIALSNFFNRITEFQRVYSDHTLHKFVEFINLMLKIGEDPKALSFDPLVAAVRVLTIHQAKGLEFRHVFIASLSNEHFPGRSRGGDAVPLPDELVKEVSDSKEEHLREERRLFYVALTRAKEQIYLSAALDYGTKRTHRISQFVLEAFPGVQVSDAYIKTRAIEKLKHFEVVPKSEEIMYEPVKRGDKIVVSRAKIDDYNSCPLKYKFLHVMPIKTPPDQAAAYGSAIHNTIAEYYLRRLDGRKVTVVELLDIFESKWKGQGFLSVEHETQRLSAGREALTNFYHRALKRPLPVSTEEAFKFQLGDAIIEGRLDLIEKIDGLVRIVDFKTSDTVKTTAKADERTKSSSQLKMYAYGYQKIHGKLPDEVSLYFVDTGIEGVYSPTQKDMDKMEAYMMDAIAGIRASNFNATPSLMTCSYCPFRTYCPYAMLPKVTA